MIHQPIKFTPILKEKIWGGEKLIQLLNKNSTKKNIGESWEISNVDGDISIVSSKENKGETLTNLIKKYKGKLVGENVYKKFGDKFPLLIKFIDAKEALSIQLHPNDAIAKKKHNSFGKTEMWYVMQADEKANLIVGFKKEVDKKTYQQCIADKKLLDILNREEVQNGDVYFIPTGRVHAIGAGVLLAEIQQTSDVTYRIYDWDRQDDDGNYRDLHTEDALESLDFKVCESYKTPLQKRNNQSTGLVDCTYFTTNFIALDAELQVNHSDKDSFVIYMCVLGKVIFKNNNFEMHLNYGETILIPNSVNEFVMQSTIKSELLEIFIK